MVTAVREWRQRAVAGPGDTRVEAASGVVALGSEAGSDGSMVNGGRIQWRDPPCGGRHRHQAARGRGLHRTSDGWARRPHDVLDGLFLFMSFPIN